MTLQEVLAVLSQNNIKLGLDGDQLKIRAAKGAITAEIKTLLVENKPALLDWIKQKNAEASQLAPIPRRQTNDKPVLSFAQQRLWFIDQLDQGNVAYNIPAATKITGELNLTVLQRVFDEIVRRHEILRTTYINDSGDAQQHIADKLRIPIETDKLSENLSNEQLIALARKDASRPFDLSTGPLLRVRIVTLPNENAKPCYLLLLNLHHIATDGWSNGVLTQEVATLYDAFSKGQPSPLPELPIQYADYAIWQHQHLSEQVLNAKLGYWLKQLADVPVLELLTDHPRPAQRSGRGRQINFSINTDVTAQLNELARQRGVTLFVVLMAAFKALLHRYTGQHDLCIGTPIAGRTRAELSPLIGFFVNTLALRTDLSGDPTFNELIDREQSVMIDAQTHQDVPFESIVDALGFSRDMSITPVFQALLALQNAPASAASEETGLSFSAIETDSQSSKFDLLINFAEIGAECFTLNAGLEYDSDLFNHSTMERLVSHLQRLLQDVTAYPDKKLSNIVLMSDKEREKVLHTWNQTDADYPRDINLATLFERQAELQGDRIALDFENGQLSYCELDQRASQLAHFLVGHKISKDDMIGVCLDRSIDMIIAILAIIKTGAAYVPLDPDYPEDRLEFILEDTASKIIITEKANVEKLQSLSVTSLPELITTEQASDDIAQQSSQWHTDPENENGDRLAYVIYTSGSTGQPKGVLAPQRGISRLVINTNYIDIGPDDALSHFSNVSFDAATYEIWGPLLNGGRLVGISKDTLLSPEKFGAILREKQVNAVFITVALFNLYISEHPDIFSGLKYLFVGGEAQDPNKIRMALAASNPPTYFSNIYGPTENTTYTSWYIIKNLPERTARIPIGEPIANTTMYVLDEHQNPVPVGLPGEIYNGGDGIALGYLNRDELTGEKFMPDPFVKNPGAIMYRTGDIGRWLEDGNIDIIGRVDDQVKIRGFRIELGEIDNAIGLISGVDKRIVIVREDEPGDKTIAAYIVAATDNTLDEIEFAQTIRSELQTHLPAYMLPKAIVILANLPVNSNGKIDKKALPKPDPSQLLGQEYVAPRNDTEASIADIWCNILNIEKVGIHDNFFELGGHSLMATRVIAHLREKFNSEVALRAFFESPTIAGLATELVQASSRQLPPLEPTDRSQPLLASFAQQRMWIIDQIQPDSPMYNIPLALRISGELDIVALERVFQQIIRRHETLRTSFIEQDGDPCQVIHDYSDWTLPVFELENNDELILQRAHAFLLAPFKLNEGSLFRAQLLKLSGDKPAYVLLVCMHHIISDGWSVDVFSQELASLYAAFSTGLDSPLPQLERQYGDFAVWQRSWLQGDELECQIHYWREQLQGVSTLELPTDYPRPPMLSAEGRRVPLRLSAQLSDTLRQLSQQQGCTLYMTLLAAFQILLSRYCNEDDIAVGSPIAGRPHTATEPMIGFFVNTLVMRNQIDRNYSFADFLQQVKTNTLEAYRHQDLPFEKLVEELQVPRNLSNTPLFQILFVLNNIGQPGNTPADVNLGNLQLTALSNDDNPDTPSAAKFDLDMALVDDTDGIYGSIEYRSALFDQRRIERLCSHFIQLLESISRNTDDPIYTLNMLGKNEYDELTKNRNGPPATIPKLNVHQLFEQQVTKTPDNIAVVCGEQQLSYQALNQQSNQLAHYLISLGVAPGTRVGICLAPSINIPVAIQAVIKCGAAYVPMDPHYPDERLTHMMDNADMAALITQSSLQGRFTDSAKQIVSIDQSVSQIQTQASHNPDIPISPDDLLYVVYTSGSTGKPKGAGVRHRNEVNLLQWYLEEYGIDASERVLIISAFGFDLTQKNLFAALCCGGRIVFVDCEYYDYHMILDTLQREQISLLNCAPSAFYPLVENSHNASELSSLRMVLFGGESIRMDALQPWIEQADFQCKISNMYGPTECTDIATIYTLGNPQQFIGQTVPIGKAISNVQLYVLDENRQLVPDGITGQLCIGGAGVGIGYLNNPAITDQVFIDNPFGEGKLYFTGDLVRCNCNNDNDGLLEFVSRVDGQVKIRGFRIELGEIESQIALHSDVKESVVNVIETTEGNPALIGYYTLTDQALSLDPQQFAQELRNTLKQSLPDYMVPVTFIAIECIPLSANGKVNREALPAPQRHQLATSEYLPPNTETEKTLCAVWQDLLGIDKVGLRDNFFDLGGHSLLAIKVNNQLREHLTIELQLSIIFETTNLEELANHIDNLLWARQGNDNINTSDDSDDREEFEL